MPSGQPCLSTADYETSAASGTYLFGTRLNVPGVDPESPLITDPILVLGSFESPDAGSGELTLTGSSLGTIDSFYIQVRDQGGGSTFALRDIPAIRMGDGIPIGGALLGDLAATGTSRIWNRYEVSMDLRDGFALIGRVETSGLTGGSQELPSLDLYFGSRVSTVPEPGTVALLATGLVGLAGFGVRRRRAAARE